MWRTCPSRTSRKMTPANRSITPKLSFCSMRPMTAATGCGPKASTKQRIMQDVERRAGGDTGAVFLSAPPSCTLERIEIPAERQNLGERIQRGAGFIDEIGIAQILGR